MLRCLIVAGLLAAACKGKASHESVAGEVGSAGSNGSAHVPITPPSGQSAASARKRRALFEKIAKLVADAGNDCDKLGAALAALTDEAREAHEAKFDLLDADRTTDAKLEADTIKPLLLGTAQCRDTSKIDAFTGALAGTER